MAVGGGATMTWNMLENRQDPAPQESIRHRARDARNLLRLLPIGAITDDTACAGNRNIGNRKAVDIDADRNEISGHQVGAEICGPLALGGVPVIDETIDRAWRIRWPVGRPKPLDPATFLIDEHGRITPQGIANRFCQAAHLPGRIDVAREQDYSPGLGFAEE